MSIFKKIMSAVLCFIMLACALCGCSEKYEEAIVYFELIEAPKTLDPQTAKSDSELLIVRNIYEGLVRESADGTIVNGACESYTYENLKYTFYLRNDLVWSNGESVTAYDFEYGLRRAVDPKIKAPFASRLFSVINAQAIAEGKADISTLGVNAIDDKTLTITLCREDKNLLKSLTTSVAMPCNKEFFENSIGKYGLDSECIISNGSYRLTKWNKEDFGIRIYKNEDYQGDFSAHNAAVFISCVNDSTQVSRLAEGSSDMAFIKGDELSAVAQNDNIINKGVQNVCWVLTLKREYSPQVRRAFAMSFSPSVYEKGLSQGFTTARSIYPQIFGINADDIGVTQYNLNEAKKIMSEQISSMKDGKFPQSTLYYYNEFGAKELATAIVGHWQQNLSAFINIESSNNLPVLQQEIGDATLDFALFPISASSSDFNEYAKNFSAVSGAATPEILQQELLKDNHIIPVAYQTTNISYVSSLENVLVYEDNGYIDFSLIVKR